MPHAGGLTLSWIHSVREINRAAWNALACDLPTPFLEHEWLSLLETSGSVTPDTGWEPRYLLAYRDGRLIAACPLYRKTHSEGEFVFDFMWAEAAGRLGISYFPKLVGMSPVTPVGAFQYLMAPEEDSRYVTGLLSDAILDYAARQGLAGVHFQYVDAQCVEPLQKNGFTLWEHPCYLWTNPGYASFADFLGALSKNSRRNIRREEKNVADRGITVRFLRGEEVDPAWHRLMYRYYLATNEKFGYWAALYLTGDFFQGLFTDFRHRLAIAAAFREGEPEPLAMALFLVKGDRLWGRYWGSREFVPYLHFNVCYYAPFHWAIGHGIRFFDPGIGAGHKARRGFTACPGASLHRFTDSSLELLFKKNIWHFNASTRRTIQDLNSGKTPNGW